MENTPETTISYFSLPSNDNMLVKIHDLHIQGLLKSIKLFTAFLLLFYTLAIILAVWVMATDNLEGAIIAASGMLVSFGGVITGFFGLRAIHYQSRKSSLRFYRVLWVFSVIMVAYLLVAYTAIGWNLDEFKLSDFLWMSISWLVVRLIFLFPTEQAKELHTILVSIIEARLDTSENNKIYQ